MGTSCDELTYRRDVTSLEKQRRVLMSYNNVSISNRTGTLLYALLTLLTSAALTHCCVSRGHTIIEVCQHDLFTCVVLETLGFWTLMCQTDLLEACHIDTCDSKCVTLTYKKIN